MFRCNLEMDVLNYSEINVLVKIEVSFILQSVLAKFTLILTYTRALGT